MKNIIHLYITDHCSTHCPFCGMGSGPAGSRYLSKENIGVLVGPLLSSSSSNIIRLLGGEPLTHPEFNDILEALLSIPQVSEVEIITNGIGIESKMPFISEMIDRYEKPIMIRFSVNYWLLSVNPLYKGNSMVFFLKEHKKNNLKFSANIGVRDLLEDQIMSVKWQKIFHSFGSRAAVVHLIAYTSEIGKRCPGSYKKKVMICPHFGVIERFIGPDGEVFKSCDDLSFNMQNHSEYYER